MRQGSTLLILGIGACYVLSGFAALLYQTAWMRQFSLVFGTSELAVAAVLSAYMGGLALGAGLAARLVRRVVRPVLCYGLLEGAIALSALLVPWLLKMAGLLYVAIFGGQPHPVDASGMGQSLFYLIIAFVVIAIPTTLMGATLPLLTKYVVRSRQQIGSGVALLYAANTAGAIAGTLVAGFLLLPALGLSGTVLFGVAVNVLVMALALLISRNIAAHDRLESAVAAGESQPVEGELPGICGSRWILPLMLVSGANSFIYEVLWTRLLSHILGGSISAFATMLAGFLGGITLGSAIAARIASSVRASTLWFVIVQCGVAVASMLVYELLPYVIPENGGPEGNVVLAILALLPATLFIGATFPLAVRILATDSVDAAPAAARIYAWNTLGAIVGATLAAFLLIPALRYEGAVRFAVNCNATLAVAAALLVARQPRLLTLVAMVFASLTLSFYRPAIPEAILRTSPLFAHVGGELRYYGVGRSATVVVIEENGFLNLRTNGLPEASANVKGAPPDRSNQRMLATMPVLARPDLDSMLIIGLGAGVALEGVPQSVKSVDVIELEPEVVRANRFFSDERAVDPLHDPRVNLVINDARSALSLTDRRYGAIVSQPSHPWTAGASHLYTREFMTLAKNHLASNGVFLQWMNTEFIDEYLLRGLCATMLDVFRYVRVYQWDPDSLFFIGSDEPLEVEAGIARTGRPLRDDPLRYLQKGVGSVEDVVAALTMDQTNVVAFAHGSGLITDDDNTMATRSARSLRDRFVLRARQLSQAIVPYDPLLQADSRLRRTLGAELNFPYVARRLESMTMRKRAVDLADSLINARDPQALVMIGLGQQAQGDRQESQKNLLLALQADANNQQARFALLQPWFPEILSQGKLPPYVSAALPALRGSALATLRGLEYAGKGNMADLVALDESLAAVLPSDLWYEISVKLRALWRIRVRLPEYQPRLANEATQLIDSALALSQDPEFYLLRIESSNVAGETLAAVETALRFMYVIDAELRAAQAGQHVLGPDFQAARLEQVGRVAELTRAAMRDQKVTTARKRLLEASIERIRARLKEADKSGG